MEQRIGVGVGVLILKDGRILLGRRHSDPSKAKSALHGEGTWSMPGGKLRFGESFEAAAEREVREETGMRISDVHTISVQSDITADSHFVTVGVSAESTDEPKVMEPEQITEWRWFPLTDLPKPLFFASEKVLNKYLAAGQQQSREEWLAPPRIKIYEALGAIADGRVSISGNQGTVLSSSKSKSYAVQYDPEKNAITANDNGSYWKGYLGYPSIAFLMLKGALQYDARYAAGLKGVPWKDINTQFKNDFDKTAEHIHALLEKKGVDLQTFLRYIDGIHENIEKLSLAKLDSKLKPPAGY